MQLRKNSNGVVPKVPRGGSREAIVEAAERLFLERELRLGEHGRTAEAADVARRTLYNQFASKEEIFPMRCFGGWQGNLREGISARRGNPRRRRGRCFVWSPA